MRTSRFSPMAAGVVYEFIEEADLDHADNLLDASELEPGKLYAMVVSDAYGLRRYQTDDLFLCKRKINGLPDLAFVRRRSLEYSFTGEKLTAEQLSAVFDQLRRFIRRILEGQVFNLRAVTFGTCASSLQSAARLAIRGVPARHDLLATRCDELLSEINCEYKSKRASGRLGPITFVAASKSKTLPNAVRQIPAADIDTRMTFSGLRAYFDFKAGHACLINIRAHHSASTSLQRFILACYLLTSSQNLCFGERSRRGHERRTSTRALVSGTRN